MSGADPRILVVSGYYPPHVGGVESVAQEYADALADAGLDVEVVTSAVGAAPGRIRPVPGARPGVRRLRALQAAHTPLAPLLLPALWRASRGRTVHLHLGHVSTDLAGVLAARARRRPLVVHFHMDTPASGPLGVVFEAYKRWVLPRLLRSAQRVVALSTEQRDLLLTRHGVRADRIAVLHNGVDADLLTLPRGGTAATGAPAVPLRVLSVGRFAPQKNLTALLCALPLTTAAVRLDLVGDGEQGPHLHALAERLVTEHGVDVHLPGVLHGEELRAAYAAADVLVLPSHREGMPLALLEAMAAGVAVVAADVQGLREFVAGRGVLLAETTPAAIAAALDALAADPARRAGLARAGREFAAELTWPRQAARLRALLRAASATTPAATPAATRRRTGEAV